jgi:8-hydroxy-5-deazaflavin:NADPH oxidoreductase
MRIGILGSGAVARTLGNAWTVKGHEIYMGARNPDGDAVTTWQKAIGSQVHIGSLKEAAEFGEVVLVAINPWTEIEHAIKPLAHELQGKTIIDVSNDIEFGALPRLAFTDQSMGERVQTWLPESNVVKTLNVTPAAMMVEPSKSGIIPAIGWLSGNNSEAKQQVMALLKDLDWTQIADLGDIHQSLLQESIGLTLSIIVTGVISQKA